MTVLPQSALRRALSPLAAAAITALCVPASSHAQSVTFNLLSADGSYALNGGAAVPLNQSIVGGTGSVDVLSFPSAGVNSAGLHSYGSSIGTFGSRSSGTGLYDVTGAFTIKLKLTNNQATAQQANFAFYITPGYLNVTPLPFTGSQFVEAGVNFNIATSNGKSFSSTAMLRDDSTGISFASTGANLYGGSGASRSVIGGNHDLDLGVLNAGQSVDLSYTLSSYAKGNALVGTTTTVPGYQQVIPEHWVEIRDCGAYATLGKTGGADVGQVLGRMIAETDVVVGGCPTHRQLVPEQIITIPAQTYLVGTAGGSQGSSGDPFSFNLGGNPTLSLPAGQNSPFSLQLSGAAAVPEPAGLALVGTALAALALMRRRRAV